MNRAAAAIALIRAAQLASVNRSTMRHALSACRALGMTHEEAAVVLTVLKCYDEDGKLMPHLEPQQALAALEQRV